MEEAGERGQPTHIRVPASLHSWYFLSWDTCKTLRIRERDLRRKSL
jgi:hypothetical protein